MRLGTRVSRFHPNANAIFSRHWNSRRAGEEAPSLLLLEYSGNSLRVRPVHDGLPTLPQPRPIRAIPERITGWAGTIFRNRLGSLYTARARRYCTVLFLAGRDERYCFKLSVLTKRIRLPEHGKSEISHRLKPNGSKKIIARKILKMVNRREAAIVLYLVADVLQDGMLDGSLAMSVIGVF